MIPAETPAIEGVFSDLQSSSFRRCARHRRKAFPYDLPRQHHRTSKAARQAGFELPTLSPQVDVDHELPPTVARRPFKSTRYCTGVWLSFYDGTLPLALAPGLTGHGLHHLGFAHLNRHLLLNDLTNGTGSSDHLLRTSPDAIVTLQTRAGDGFCQHVH